MANGAALDPATLVAAARIHQEQGRLDEAQGCCEAALAVAPDHAEAAHQLGMLHLAAGRAEQGIALLRRAAERAPGVAAAWYNLAMALSRHGRFDEAVEAFPRALALRPDRPGAHRHYGMALWHADRREDAIAALREAVRLAPDDPDIRVQFGALLAETRALEAAETEFRAVIATHPEHAEAHFKLGMAVQRQDRDEAAIEHYRRAIALRPDHAEAQFSLGVALAGLNRPAEALAAYAGALAAQPGHVRAQFNSSLMHLMSGDLAAGWQAYEARFESGALPRSPHEATRPRWHGERVQKLTLLLHTEQGYGDTLQFVRFAAMAQQRGARVLLEVQPALRKLLALRFGDAVFAQGEDLPAFDLQCPLPSLPRVFGTTLRTMPAAVPYLTAPPERIAAWATRLPRDGRRRVGVVWAGNKRKPGDIKRSIPLGQFRRLLDAPGYRFVALPAEDRDGDTEMLAELPEIVDLRGELGDFADTAALIAQLDLVITVDTAAAHLAGALGVPVWLLLPWAPDFRWMLQREDTPWYPTMRLFRQPRRDDWADVLDRVRQSLAVR